MARVTKCIGCGEAMVNIGSSMCDPCAIKAVRPAPLDVKALRKLHHAATVTSGELGLSACAEWAMALEDNATRLLDAAEERDRLEEERTEALGAYVQEMVRLQATRDAAIARAESAEADAHRLRDELELMRSYLGHQDQDADHAWMAEHMRKVLAGIDPDPEITAALTAGDGPGKAGGG